MAKLNFCNPFFDKGLEGFCRLLAVLCLAIVGCLGANISSAWSQTCGNGVIESGESCDDLNFRNSDGCSSVCQLEARSCTNRYVAASGQTYNSVLAAYNAAQNGDNIVILPGTYNVDAFRATSTIITKNVHFIGAGYSPSQVLLTASIGTSSLRVDFNTMTAPVRAVSFRNLTYQRNSADQVCDISIVGHATSSALANIRMENSIFNLSDNRTWVACLTSGKASLVSSYNDYTGARSAIYRASGSGTVLTAEARRIYSSAAWESEASGGVVNWTLADISGTRSSNGTYAYTLPTNFFPCESVPNCGDGYIQSGEECDDQNLDNTDECTNFCTLAACGDSFLQFGEECDDGNGLNSDSCTNACRFPVCGDGFVQTGETCDDGNTSNNDTCTNSCQPAVCGDGYLQSGEECDDGDADDTNGCTAACEVTPNICAGPGGSDINNFAAGLGTEGSPYIICNPQQLLKLAQNISAHYRLGSDIDATTVSAPLANNFQGVFDGAGFTISNLTLNRPQDVYVGLFSRLSTQGLIENLILDQPQITGLNYVGAVTGYSQGTISGVSVTSGQVSAGSFVGLIAGYSAGTIEQSITSGTVTATERFGGGLVGDQRGGVIRLSRSSATVSAAYDCGGIAGRLGGTGLVSNVYASGSISATEASAGGIVGSLSGGALSNSYFYGTSSAVAEPTKAGGAVGTYSAGTLSGVVWNENTCLTCNFRPEGSYGVSSAGMKQIVFYASLGFNFSNTWGLESGAYPSFLWEHPEFLIVRTLSSGAGTELDPYLISSIQDLEAIGLHDNYRQAGVYHKLIQDIDFLGVEYPLLGGTGSPFQAIFDGNDHTLSNFTLPWGGSSDVGMFRVIGSSGQVKNLHVSGVVASGKSRVGVVSGTNQGTISNITLDQIALSGAESIGGVAGKNEGTISSILVTQGSVTADNDHAGGIAGYSVGTISRTSFSGSVLALDRSAGGIVGYLAAGSVTLSRSTGTVNATYNAGGIAGWSQAAGSSTTDCYSNSTVTATNYAGGIVGFVNAGSVQRTFFTGTATATTAPEKDGAIIGGLISATISASLWSSEICPSCSIDRAGTFNRPTARLKNPLAFANLGYDYSTTWGQQSGAFPRLLWENPGDALTTTLSSGTGIESDPYLITSYDDLTKLGLNQSYWASGVYLQLANSLDLALVEPPMLGLVSVPFQAQFDGNNESLSNVTLDYDSIDRVGLFRVLGSLGKVSDLSIDHVNVIGENYVGGLVAQTSGVVERIQASDISVHARSYAGSVGGLVNGTLRDISVNSGDVLTESNYAGGIAGYLDTSSANFTRLIYSGSVNALSDYAGGITGLLNMGTISLSHSSGTVSVGSSYAGGLAGYLSHASSLLENSYSSATVTAGYRHSGGIAGYVALGTVRYTWFNGTSTASDVTYDGGTAGSNPGGSLTRNLYNSTICTSCSNSLSGVEGLATSPLQYRLTYYYRDFDFNTVWGMPGSTGYPVLLWQYPAQAVNMTLGSGTGTQLDPYQIETYEDLEKLALNSSYLASGLYFSLAQDINLSGKVGIKIGKTASPFQGTFEGANHTLSNFSLSLPGYANIGLFANVSSSGTIRNLVVNNVSINGGNYTGVIAGLNEGLIDNLQLNTINVIASSGGNRKGGAVGRNTGSINNVTITSPTITAGTSSPYTGGLAGESTGSVTNIVINSLAISSGSTDTGGVVGYNTGTIYRAYVSGNITSNEISTGGISGYSSNSIQQTEFSGTVQGKDHSGGIVGYLTSTGSIENNLALGNVTVTGDNAGGIVGYGGTSSTVRYNYYVGSASDLSGETADGGIIGGSTPATISANFYNAEICPGCTFSPAGVEDRPTSFLKQVQTFATVGWDFSSVWGMPTPANYPQLLWLHPADVYTLPVLTQGSGTELDPYLIQTEEDLITLGLNSSYWNSGTFLTLDANLNLSNIEPPVIGRSGTPFNASFNGSGHSISNYTTSLAGTNYIGLFGAIGASGIVENLTLTNFSINGSSYIGALAGSNLGTIRNITLQTVLVQALTGGQRKGGLVGKNDGLVEQVTITNATVTSGTSSQYTGGAIGENTGTAQDVFINNLSLQSSSSDSGGVAGRNSGLIARSVTQGSLNCSGDSVGGVAGYNTGTVRLSEYSGSVLGQSYIGGIVGNSAGSPLIENNRAFANVSCTTDYAGGVAGYGVAGGTLRYNYFIGLSNDGSGGTNDGGIVGAIPFNTSVGNFFNLDLCPNCSFRAAGAESRPTSRLKQVQTYYQAGYDFSSVWGFPSPADYPTFLWRVPGDSYSLPTLTQGTGTAQDPYLITTVSELTTLGLNSLYWAPGTYITLAADLSLVGIEPPLISRGGNAFGGVFEGGNHSIQGYSYSLSGVNYLGLFAELGLTAAVRNLTLENLDINGSSYVGGVAGRNLGTIEDLTMSNIAVTSVTGGTRKGAIAGRNEGTIQNLQVSTVSVSGAANSQYTGGLVGDSTGTVQDVEATAVTVSAQTNDAGAAVGSNSGTLTRLSVQGGVTSTVDQVGGIAGTSSGPISLSSFTGNVQGRTGVGGIVGTITATPTIQNNFARGNVTATTDNAGGIVGTGTALATVRYNYYVGTANDGTGGTNDGGIFGATTASTSYGNLFQGSSCPNCSYKPAGVVSGTTSNLKHPSIYLTLGFDFNTVWGLNVGVDYPVLLWQDPGKAVSFPALPSGSGTVGDPYSIASLDNLYAVAARPALWASDTYYVLTNDLDFSTWGDIPTPTLGSPATPFQGIINGQGFTIRASRWDLDGANDVALIRSLGASGQIKNLTLYEPYVRGDSRVAGVVASNSGLIEEVSAVGVTILGADYVGAITGTSSGTLNKVRSFRGSITTEVQYGGGIAGAVTAGSLASSYGTANLSGVNNIGGIVGLLSGGLVENCFARATISGTSGIGGIVGTSSGTNEVRNVYFAGTANASSAANDGGITGALTTGTRSSCFWDNQVCTTCSQTYAGETAATTATMQSAATYASWSSGIWDIGNGYYPLLLWNRGAAVIFDHPDAQSVLEGTSASFSIGASGDNLTYSWRLNGSLLANGTRPSGMIVAGATTASLSLSNVRRQEAGGIESLVANPVAVITSNSAQFVVNYLPSFTLQPQGAVLLEGTPYSMTSTATGVPTPTVTWYQGANSVGSGGSHGWLTVAPSNSGTYHAKAENIVGTVSSSNVSISVLSLISSASVIEGQVANFTASVSGTEVYSYQWQQRMFGGNWENLVGETLSQLSLDTTLADDDSKIRVRVTSPTGSTLSNEVDLNVDLAPVGDVVTSANPNPVLLGNSVTLSVTVGRGSAPFHYQWQKKVSGVWANISPSPDASTYTFSPQKTDNGILYRAIASNASWSTPGDSVQLNVEYPPTISNQTQNAVAGFGQSVQLLITAGANPAPTVSWEKGGTPVGSGAQLSLDPLQASHVGTYIANVANLHGEVESNPIVVSGIERPDDVEVLERELVTFEAVVIGSGIYDYQWERQRPSEDWEILSDQTEETLEFSSSLTDDGSLYRVRVTTLGAEGVSEPALLTVNPSAPSDVSITPENLVGVSGETISLVVNTSRGTMPLHYNWEVSSGALWVPLESSSDSFSHELLLGRALLGKHLRVTVTNIYGSATSTPQLITVSYAPIFDQQPAKLVVAEGQNAEFSVVFDANPPGTLRWYHGTDPLGTANTHSITNASATLSGIYKALAQNALGSTWSAEGRLSVVHPLLDQIVAVGEMVTISANVSGGGDYTYQWEKKPFGNSWQTIVGATGQQLLFPARSADHRTQYRVIVQEGSSQATSVHMTLGVGGPTGVNITLNVTTPIVDVNTESSLVASISNATGPFQYVWQKLTDQGWEPVAGAPDAASAQITMQAADHNRKFRVVLTCAEGVYESNAVTQLVRSAPALPIEPSGLIVAEGDTVQRTLSVTGYPTPVVEWFRDGLKIGQGTLEIPGIEPEDQGLYFARATNDLGSVESSTFPISVIENIEDQTAVHTTSAEFEVVVAGGEVYTYQWQVSENAGQSWTNLDGETSTTLSVIAELEHPDRLYRVVVSANAISGYSNGALLTVLPAIPSALQISPAAPQVSIGDVVTLTSEVIGGGVSLNWVWQKKDLQATTWTTISGATQSTYSFTAQPGDNGRSYRAVVSNQYGTATSNVSSITVYFEPLVGSIPAQALATFTDGYELSVAVSGNPRPEVSWFRKRTGSNSEEFVGTGKKLKLEGDNLVSGIYRAKATNNLGEKYSGELKLGILGYLGSQSVTDSALVTFSAAVSGVDSPQYAWEVKLAGQTNWRSISGANTSKLQFAAKLASSGNKYRVKVTTQTVSAVSNEASLLVTSAEKGTISGRVTKDGAGLGGVSVTLAGERSTTTNSLGEYVFSDLELGKVYTIQPSHSSLSFVPGRVNVTLTSNKTQNFAAYVGRQLSGKILRGTDPIGGALVKLFENGLLVRMVEADSSGNYSFSNVANSAYLLRAESQGVDLAEERLDLTTPASEDPVLDLQVKQQTFLGEEVLSLWNTYLGMVNVLEISNKGAARMRIKVSVYSSRNQSSGNTAPLAILPWTAIAAGTQRDIIINDLPGVIPDDYGIVVIEHDKVEIDGRLSTYKPSTDQGEGDIELGDYEFAFNLPFTVPARGMRYIPFNTIQPSVHSEELDRAVYNWLTVANGEPSTQRFDCVYYSAAGKALKTLSFSVPAFGRVDIDGGHQTVGFGSIGLIRVLPKDMGAKYQASINRYGSIVSAEESDSRFNFAFAVTATTGSSGLQALPLTAVTGMDSYVEVINLSGKNESVNLRVFDDKGRSLRPELKISLPARAQSHMKTTDLLGTAASGLVEVAPIANAKIYSALTTYYSDESHHLLSADRTVGGYALTPVLVGGYNLYLDMYNWLRLYNLGNSATTVTLELREVGSEPRRFTRRINAHGRFDFGLHENAAFGTNPNTYGVVKISSSPPSPLLGEMVRVRSSSEEAIDFVFTMPLR